MKFSVLIPVYFKEDASHLKESLKSIFNQTVSPSEVVIVEDGKLTNQLYEVLDEFENNFSILKRISLENNSGLGNALNVGLNYCTYDIVARMDSDDICSYNRFERQLEIFEKFPNVEVVSCWISEFNNNIDNIVAIKKIPEYHYEIFKYGKKRCPINHPAVMFKKESVSFAGGYQTFPLFEDYFLWIRMILNGSKFYNIQESLLFFRTSHELYRRRGGWKYVKDNSRFQLWMLKSGYISILNMINSLFIRGIVYMMPNVVRMKIYKYFLRS